MQGEPVAALKYATSSWETLHSSPAFAVAGLAALQSKNVAALVLWQSRTAL